MDGSGLLTVEQLTQSPALQMRLLAGASGLGRRVAWAHVSELEDPSPWLAGAELIMTTGLGFPRVAGKQRAYVERLDDAGVAGLAVSAHLHMPPLSRTALAAADSARLPDPRGAAVGALHRHRAGGGRGGAGRQHAAAQCPAAGLRRGPLADLGRARRGAGVRSAGPAVGSATVHLYGVGRAAAPWGAGAADRATPPAAVVGRAADGAGWFRAADPRGRRTGADICWRWSKKGWPTPGWPWSSTSPPSPRCS